MSHTLHNFEVCYLLRTPASPEQVEFTKAPGWFVHRATMVGTDAVSLAREIREAGGVPTRITAMPPRSAWRNLVTMVVSPVPTDFRQQFLQAVGFSISGGMSAFKALAHAIESDNGPQRAALNPALVILRRGGGFAEAITATELYDDSTLAILAAGERIGDLPSAIDSALAHAKTVTGSLLMVRAALAWMVLDLLSIVSTVWGIRFGFLPYIEKQGMETDAPEKLAAFKHSLQFAYVANDILLAVSLLAGGLFLLGAWAYWGRNPGLRRWVDLQIQRIPGIRDALLHGGFANACRVAASLLSSGVTLTNTLAIASQASRLTTIHDFWLTAVQRLDAGLAVADALNQSVLTSTERMLIQAHDDQSQLATTLNIMATQRDEMAKRGSKLFFQIAMGTTIVYCSLAVLVALYVVWIQNESLMSGML